MTAVAAGAAPAAVVPSEAGPGIAPGTALGRRALCLPGSEAHYIGLSLTRIIQGKAGRSAGPINYPLWFRSD